MCPQKALASRPKRPHAGDSSENPRRRKGKEAQSPQGILFPSSGKASMASRAILSGRKVSFPFLDAEGFRIGSWIKQQGWEMLCSLEESTYPGLIREFFENLRIGTGSIIESSVKGVVIVLNEQRIGQFLEMPKVGMAYPRLTDKAAALRCILEKEEVNPLDNVTANMLSVELRLLHSIIGRIFLPKSGRFDWVAEREIAVMFHLIQGNHMNLPFMMIEHIKDAAKRLKGCLPYGMFFTLVFKKFEVNLEGEESKVLMHFDYFNERSLHRMGYRKVEGQWVRRAGGPVGAVHSSSSSDSSSESSSSSSDDHDTTEAPERVEPQATTVSPPPAVRSSPSSVPTASMSPRASPFQQTQTPSASIDTVMQRMESLFSTLRGDIDRHHEELRRDLDHQHSELRQEMRGLSQRIEALELSRGSSSSDTFGMEARIAEEASVLSRKVDEAIAQQQGVSDHLLAGLRSLEARLQDILSYIPPQPQPQPTSSQPTSSQPTRSQPTRSQSTRPPVSTTIAARTRSRRVRPSTSSTTIELPSDEE